MKFLTGARLEYIAERIISAYTFAHVKLTDGYALPPLYAHMEMTYRCSICCPTCFQGIKAKEDPDPVNTDGWKSIIDQFPSYTLLTLTGGEVTIRDDFRELASYALKRHKCHITTNGFTLDDELAEFIIRSGFIVVGVSIDGDRESHDKIRDKDGAFDKTWRGLMSLLKWKKKLRKKIPLIDIKILIFEHNLNSISRLIEKISQTEVNLISFSFVKIAPMQANPHLTNDMNLIYQDCDFPSGFNVKELESIFSKIEARLKAAEIAVRYYPRMRSHKQFVNYFKRDSLIKRYLPCYMPWACFHVNNYGDVYPCLSYRLGNLLKQSLPEILNTEKSRNFRRVVKKSILLPQCEGCCYIRVRGE